MRPTVILAVIALAACGGTQPTRPRELLDEKTGSTVSVVSAPLIFARERTDVAAHARDYATLVAAEIDQSGAFQDYLLLYRWSTVDRRMSPPPQPEAGQLRILAHGRVVDLKPLDSMPTGLEHRRELHLPVHGEVVAHAYIVDAQTLRFLAESESLSIRMPQEPLDAPFGLWQDGRAALLEFSKSAGP